MDGLFLIIMLGLLAYSGIFIFVFFIRAFMPKNSHQKKNADALREVSRSNRNQQRNARRTSGNRTTNRSVSSSRNANKQQSWRELASEFKEALNELDSDNSKQASTQKRNTVNKAKPKRNTSRGHSREGSGSSEGLWGREGTSSLEGSKGLEGSASYEGTEFHPQGHSMKKKPVKSKSSSRGAYSSRHKISKTDLQKNIVNAVIYKEILDKPRSKRPIR